MPIGVFADCLSVFLGGAAGALAGKALPGELQEKLPVVFGFCSISIGVGSIIKASSMPPVVMALLVGYILGQTLHLEEKATAFFRWLVKALRLGGQDIDMDFYITAVALFCCSGFGWFGTLTEALSGDPFLQGGAGFLYCCGLCGGLGPGPLRHPSASTGGAAGGVWSRTAAGSLGESYHAGGPDGLRWGDHLGHRPSSRQNQIVPSHRPYAGTAAGHAPVCTLDCFGRVTARKEF